MDNIAQICTGLRITRPSLSAEQLLALDSPSAEFEAHIPADSGPDFWIYTINGNTYDGECMVVRAALPIKAETMAQEGLRDTIRALRRFEHNTGLQAQVEVKPA